MARRDLLQQMVESIPSDVLPATWNTFDFQTFSNSKTLWDYQQQALENATRALWKYYEDCGDYQPGEQAEVNARRKLRMADWYADHDLEGSLDIPLPANRKLRGLLGEYFAPTGRSIPFSSFSNRASFWMATGSGKTLVLVKLIETLHQLVQRREIPANDILVLTYREDLIAQLKTHVAEFNSYHPELYIRLRDLKEYAEAKRDTSSLFKHSELTVFYYRSDNLSDEQKDKIIDFRNYDDAGKWYVLLDEAHKGDFADSKRRHIYSILSRNGFLFNFSATFTDPRDRTTTVANFNLSEFIRAGYGKHIAILQQEIRAFRDDEDYSNEEKRKVVLKSLLMLTYARRFYDEVCGVRNGLYHRPLLVALVHTVNTEESDLKLFFRELARVGARDVSPELFQTAKEELWQELRDRPPVLFEDDVRLTTDEEAFMGLTMGDILRSVYNADGFGEVEVRRRPSDKQEVAFKLKSSDLPFALVKIGDISQWLRDELDGYEIIETFEDEGYFQSLNREGSEINVLMGSRSFHEGWDSNRPNVLNFINIGTRTAAKKFILQSVGRGVRIQPFGNERQRLVYLHNANRVDSDLYEGIKRKVQPVETLMIFGTNREALKIVVEELGDQDKTPRLGQLDLFPNRDAVPGPLLVPAYKFASRTLREPDAGPRFGIAASERDLLRRYLEYVDDDRVLLMEHRAGAEDIRALRASLESPDRYFNDEDREYRSVDLLLQRLLAYFSIVPRELDRLKELEDEIRHFRNVTVTFQDVGELQAKVTRVAEYPDRLREAQAQYGKVTPEEYERVRRGVSCEETFRHHSRSIKIRYIKDHYYIPMILSDEQERIDYISHIIQTPSEIKFVNDLECHLDGPNRFGELDWWLFSRLDEATDDVRIPYFDRRENKQKDFKPDFIFWMQRGNDYSIVFVDPKGTVHSDYGFKIDGYRAIFEENHLPRVLPHNGLNVRVFASLYTPDVGVLPDSAYREHWYDSPGSLLERVLASPRG